jgi:glucose-6-phosphate 1-epimerase
MGSGASSEASAAIEKASVEEVKAAVACLSVADRDKLAAALGKSGPAKGKGDLDTVILRQGGSSAEIYLLGATLTSFKTADGLEQIFVSPGAIFDGKKAIRGGVPVVFPQFGQPDKAMAQHGFARSSIWTVKEVIDGAEDAGSSATFTLADSEATREKWPNKFRLEYTVRLFKDKLDMVLRIVNTGDATFQFHTLLHTYFQVPDIANIGVSDFAGAKYIDKVKGGEEALQEASNVEFPSFTDRVFASCPLKDGKLPKAINLKADGKILCECINGARFSAEDNPDKLVDAESIDVVCWNPYEEASPGDLPPPAFKNFVCVEPGLVSKFYELPPKAVAELSQTIIPRK